MYYYYHNLCHKNFKNGNVQNYHNVWKCIPSSYNNKKSKYQMGSMSNETPMKPQEAFPSQVQEFKNWHDSNAPTQQTN